MTYLKRQIDLLLALELDKDGDLVHLEQPENVGLDELAQLLLVVLEPLEPQDDEQRFLAYHLLSPPQRPPRPAVVVFPPQLQRRRRPFSDPCPRRIKERKTSYLLLRGVRNEDDSKQFRIGGGEGCGF